MRDTIFALATTPGRAALAVIRTSGPNAQRLLQTIAGRLPPPRRASLRSLTNNMGEIIDQALVLWFPKPHSYTGEDVFELQLHGGPAVVEAVAEMLLRSGARLAEPGEFTRRAFEAGRLDLSQAEAVADLVDAETAAQRRQALSQLGGSQSEKAEHWRSLLLESLAFLEAQIDFADEEIPADVDSRCRKVLSQLVEELTTALGDMRGERIRAGLRIALVGPPNAGKSSLLNAVTGRDAAIVTSEAGTTRDVIEVELILGGYKAILADTAGVRETSNQIEQEGVRRATAWAENADLRIFVVDSTSQAPLGEFFPRLRQAGDIVVMTKKDLIKGLAFEDQPFAGLGRIYTSVYEPQSIEAIIGRLTAWATSAMSGADVPAVTRARHRLILTEAKSHLVRGLLRASGGVELLAEDVRLAARAIERLAGRINSEDVLDRVFGSFCIGK